MSLLHSSTRRPPALKETDCDHEITLVDHTKRRSNHAPSFSADEARTPSLEVLSTSSSRRHSDAPLRKARSKLHNEVTRRRYRKYQDRRLDDGGTGDDEDGEGEGEGEEEGEGFVEVSRRGTPEGAESARGSIRFGGSQRRAKRQAPPESAIDVLYENQRGCFLCGIPLFSAKALGNLDPAPWTNAAFKTSATNPTNAQVPDPCWEWAWKEWSINHMDEVDEEGWEYSFAFANLFSWHGPTWWNSFVRRRAWIRKRVKTSKAYAGSDGHLLTPDYFTIHPRPNRSRSRGSTADGGSVSHRMSAAEIASRELEGGAIFDDISDINTLLKALRLARIDREKMEAVESFIVNGGQELYYLRERMHDVMKVFIFQASRRLLLSHLINIFNDAAEEVKKMTDEGKVPDPATKQRLENLEEAVKHADDEVKKLEFWSDVKDMTAKGEVKGAMDESHGWDSRWIGLDNSAPKDVISNQDMPGTDDCAIGEGSDTALASRSGFGAGSVNAKAKGRENAED